MTTCHIVTVPTRLASLASTVGSLYPQVDEIYVMLNGHTEAPPIEDPLKKIHYEFLDNSRGDAAKFLNFNQRDGFVFTCDDDLVYPFNYCAYMISKYHQHPHSIITLHGKVFQKPIVSSHRGFRENYHCLHTVVGDHPNVDTGGTGVMLLHTADIKIDIADFPRPNMADIWLSKLAHSQRVPIVVVEHRLGYLGYTHPLETIWTKQTKEQNAYEAKILNGFLK